MITEFIDNNTKYVPKPAIMNGRKGNIWTIWKYIDCGWVLVGEIFAGKTATKQDIIVGGHYFCPNQPKKPSLIGAAYRFRKVMGYLKKKIKIHCDKSP
jgi:hypothetical protein